MNLTLYVVTPFDPSVRTLYVLAPDPIKAVDAAHYSMPGGILSVVAIANNAYQGDTFPRFVGWEPPTECHSQGTENGR